MNTEVEHSEGVGRIAILNSVEYASSIVELIVVESKYLNLL
jgi:hypothetical protein